MDIHNERVSLMYKARMKKGYSQNDIGKLIGYKRDMISKIERGYRQPPYSKIIMLSFILDVDLLELMVDLAEYEKYPKI